MEITEVKVKLVNRRGNKLRAFCTVTLDNSFVIRDLKVIEGARGAFVAMPSRKLTDRCLKCGNKNHLRAKFCSECGVKLTIDRTVRDSSGRIRLHADVAHPINSATRELFQKKVLDAYLQELEYSKRPGYKPSEIYTKGEEPDESDIPEGEGKGI
jgi:stage V sporulation protein G